MSRPRIKWRRTEHASREFLLEEVKIHFRKPATIARGWFAAPHLRVNGRGLPLFLYFFIILMILSRKTSCSMFWNLWKWVVLTEKWPKKGARLKALASVYFTSTSCFCPCPSSSQNQYNLSINITFLVSLHQTPNCNFTYLWST